MPQILETPTWTLKSGGTCWVVVKERKLSYHSQELYSLVYIHIVLLGCCCWAVVKERTLGYHSQELCSFVYIRIVAT